MGVLSCASFVCWSLRVLFLAASVVKGMWLISGAFLEVSALLGIWLDRGWVVEMTDG